MQNSAIHRTDCLSRPWLLNAGVPAAALPSQGRARPTRR
jgi:hypothetical protein